MTLGKYDENFNESILDKILKKLLEEDSKKNSEEILNELFLSEYEQENIETENFRKKEKLFDKIDRDEIDPYRILEKLIEILIDSKYSKHRQAIPHLLFSKIYVHNMNYWHTEKIKYIFQVLFNDQISLVVRALIEKTCDFFILYWEDIIKCIKQNDSKDSNSNLVDQEKNVLEHQILCERANKNILMFFVNNLLDEDILKFIVVLQDKNNYIKSGAGDLFCLQHMIFKLDFPNISENNSEYSRVLELLESFLKKSNWGVRLSIVRRLKYMPSFYENILSNLQGESDETILVELIEKLKDKDILIYLKEDEKIRIKILDEIEKRVENGFSFLMEKDDLILQEILETRENNFNRQTLLKERKLRYETLISHISDSKIGFGTNQFRNELISFLEKDPSNEVRFKTMNILKRQNLILFFCTNANWRWRLRTLELLIEYLNDVSDTMIYREIFIEKFFEFLRDRAAYVREFAASNFNIEILSYTERKKFFELLNKFVSRMKKNYRFRVSIIPLILNCYNVIKEKISHYKENIENFKISAKDAPFSQISAFGDKEDLSFLENTLKELQNDPIGMVREKLESMESKKIL